MVGAAVGVGAGVVGATVGVGAGVVGAAVGAGVGPGPSAIVECNVFPICIISALESENVTG